MPLKFNLAVQGHLGPRAWTCLYALKDEHCFLNHHQRRHPRSIYQKKLHSIAKQFVGVFNSLDEVENAYRYETEKLGNAYNILLEQYRELLYRLNEHHDDCLSILRGLCPPERAKHETFDSKFLQKSKLPGANSFMQATKEYRDNHIGILVNKMKHSQAELSSIYMYPSSDRVPVDFRPGYFLCDVLPGGLLGPNAKLHFEGRTAFSFYRDMRIHLWWLYKMGDLLATAIEAAIEGVHKEKLTLDSCEFDVPNLLDVLRRCSMLPLRFFPDEVKRPYPTIQISDDGAQLVMEFAKRLRGGFPVGMKFRTTITVDKEHKANKLPYYGSEYTKWERGA